MIERCSGWQVDLFRRSVKKRIKLEILKSLLELRQREIFLDIGCGYGLLCLYSALQDAEVVGIDIDVEKLAAAKLLLVENRKAVSCHFIIADARYLPFKTASFDEVLCSEVLEHILDDQLAIKEIGRICKEGASLVITTPLISRGRDLTQISKKLLRVHGERFGHIRQGYMKRDLIEMLAANRLEVVEARVYSNLMTEVIEDALTAYAFAYRKDIATQRKSLLRSRMFSIYSLIHPFAMKIVRLDHLLPNWMSHQIAIKGIRRASSFEMS